MKENNMDTIVLARYMQVLTNSFLPAFIGGNPYKQAYERGVKIIGATSHYLPEELDEGLIIEQDIIRISHRDSVKVLIRRGRDLERIVLAKAVNYHAEHSILVKRKEDGCL